MSHEGLVSLELHPSAFLPSYSFHCGSAVFPQDGHEQLFAQLESLEEEIAHLEEPQKAAAEQQRLLAQQLEQMQPELLKKEWGLGSSRRFLQIEGQCWYW